MIPDFNDAGQKNLKRLLLLCLLSANQTPLVETIDQDQIVQNVQSDFETICLFVLEFTAILTAEVIAWR